MPIIVYLPFGVGDIPLSDASGLWWRGSTGDPWNLYVGTQISPDGLTTAAERAAADLAYSKRVYFDVNTGIVMRDGTPFDRSSSDWSARVATVWNKSVNPPNNSQLDRDRIEIVDVQVGTDASLASVPNGATAYPSRLDDFAVRAWVRNNGTQRAIVQIHEHASVPDTSQRTDRDVPSDQVGGWLEPGQTGAFSQSWGFAHSPVTITIQSQQVDPNTGQYENVGSPYTIVIGGGGTQMQPGPPARVQLPPSANNPPVNNPNPTVPPSQPIRVPPSIPIGTTCDGLLIGNNCVSIPLLLIIGVFAAVVIVHV